MENIKSNASTSCLSKAISTVKINGVEMNALVDTGSSESFISTNIAKKSRLKIIHLNSHWPMANVSLSSQITGYIFVGHELNQTNCTKNNFFYLCCDIIQDHDFIKQYSSIKLLLKGLKPMLNICGLAVINVQYPSLFESLIKNVKQLLLNIFT